MRGRPNNPLQQTGRPFRLFEPFRPSRPGVETRNRKPLRPPAPFAAQWEIRFGPDNRFRVLYDIDEAERAVQIVAIGEKDGNRLIVGGEEVAL